ncbi:hypothetical protein [Vibrio rotiferianus]|uniref:hypothetical protein n=1 Tax=Vibrio rotiferianus TaxID=190895 RepID=UPI0012DFFE8C|nr:hypothetical protein [Vibrio rotiferianus]
MYKEYFHGVTNWISGGAASAALALVVFLPTVESLDDKYSSWALNLFVFCIPLFLVCAVLCQESKAKNNAPKQLASCLGLMFLPACILMVIGFGLLCVAISFEALSAYILALFWVFVVLHIYKKSKP